ncbi:aldolase/citrate lyase family protein [Marinovum sp. 2_MG-2023]|uniref:HpcH/HpaI aldolase family protein n=1 Tax=unclassified Marinovum TaxID=2647166 RepID=UPI0026E40C4B|nr:MULTISPECIES: aldolase/citrate lyase family protein [unclassified Marinovum]MDO6732794.1 aldolase/citrate lyase family protein [Marinovum sp. 2_MG-2023]MDO6782063.1 aldolase/citrate lyase family protein [Marinovum sp. 1_MG-2023]
MTFKQKLQRRRPAYGIWISDGWITSVEMAGDLGYDFVLVDLEHSPHGLDTVTQSLRMLKGSETDCVVRVTGQDPLLIKRLLDLGATNLMVPMVETGDQARDLVSECRYPPAGRRGCASAVVRASGYGLVQDYVARADAGLCLIAQIESAMGLENADEISGTAGIDAIFVGPTDLSGALGQVGAFDRPEFAEAVTRIEAATRSAGKAFGFMPVPGFEAEVLAARGVNMIAGPSDVVLLRDAMRMQLQNWIAESGS